MGKTKPSLKSNDKEGFLRAFTDEWADMEAEYGVTLAMGITPTHRKGVMQIRLAATPDPASESAYFGGAYQCEFPTAAVESLEACLYRCCVRLERVLRDRNSLPMGRA